MLRNKPNGGKAEYSVRQNNTEKIGPKEEILLAGQQNNVYIENYRPSNLDKARLIV
jgi:hypothetical protein